jgi:16S rRNA (cytosine967-C5)-methyltransferase
VDIGASGTVKSPRDDSVSPARRCAYIVIRRVFEQGAYADRALRAEAAGLSARDRALATALAFGTVQRRRTLDYVTGKLASRPVERLEAPVLAALRLGLFQLMFMNGVAPHAAVNESVELAKREGRGGATLVNAVLRRALREGARPLEGLDEAIVAEAAILHSVPDWLAEQFSAELGADRALRLMRVVNQAAESALRINTLRAAPAQLLPRLPVPAHAAPDLSEGLVLEAPFDAHSSELFHQGMIMPQSRGSMLVGRILGPKPGDRVLDLCAAPGGKTTHLAALTEDRGLILAVEHHRGRAAALARTCERMGARSVAVEVADAAQYRSDQPYHRVLVDPPCSGLGTLQSRPDLRWRITPNAIRGLVSLQEQILSAAAESTAPGGTLVYSVCTISLAESTALIDRFLAEHPSFLADDLQREHPAWADPRGPNHLQLLPDRDGTDGFFIARLRRRTP